MLSCASWLAFAVVTASCGSADRGAVKPGGGGPKADGGALPGTGGRDMPGPGMPGTGGAGAPVGGATGTQPPKMPMGMKGTGGAGSIVVGIPTPGAPNVVFPGGGPNGHKPLVAGCTPASARECPSATGACQTSATSNPTGTTTGSICFYGSATGSTTTTTTSSSPAATIEYLHETAGGQEYYRFRITFDPAFVDNTYGTNAIGWIQKGHTFKDLVGSDHAELSLFDGGKTLVSMFDIDYITADATASCKYGALGVSGGEGKMLVGSATDVLASTTSLDRNLNGCGYCANAACGGDCTVNSPATDASYTPNSAAPNWDYRVVYEVWIKASVFGSAGFGGASITFVHASPSKASTNTVTVIPKTCGCPVGTVEFLTSEGAKSCLPPGTGCAEGTIDFITSEGAKTCLPTGSPCPTGFTTWLVNEGVCVPVPKNGVCPTGYRLDPTSEGARCI